MSPLPTFLSFITTLTDRNTLSTLLSYRALFSCMVRSKADWHLDFRDLDWVKFYWALSLGDSAAEWREEKVGRYSYSNCLLACEYYELNRIFLGFIWWTFLLVTRVEMLFSITLNYTLSWRRACDLIWMRELLLGIKVRSWLFMCILIKFIAPSYLLHVLSSTATPTHK